MRRIEADDLPKRLDSVDKLLERFHLNFSQLHLQRRPTTCVLVAWMKNNQLAQHIRQLLELARRTIQARQRTQSDQIRLIKAQDLAPAHER